VNNITNFGCFVDIGVKESGLVHISQLKAGFVSDVNEVVKLHQHVEVKVTEVDEDRKNTTDDGDIISFKFYFVFYCNQFTNKD
jgi:predicted RNA-binding protein with RPS1 domain